MIYIFHVQQLLYFSLPSANICDMIKGNESDVADIIFEILAILILILLFYIVLSIDKLLITLKLDM